MKYSFFFFTIIIAVLLTSCLSIEEHVTIGDDGSGVLEIRYTFSEEFAGFGRLGNDEHTFPIPVEEDRFREGASVIDGIRFKSYSSKLKDGVYTIEGAVRFDTVEALSEFMFGYGGSVELDESGSDTTLTFAFLTRGVVEMTQDAEDMIREFFDDQTVTFSARVPRPVSSVNAGAYDGRDAEITVSVSELVAVEDFTWVVSWQ